MCPPLFVVLNAHIFFTQYLVLHLVITRDIDSQLSHGLAAKKKISFLILVGWAKLFSNIGLLGNWMWMIQFFKDLGLHWICFSLWIWQSFSIYMYLCEDWNSSFSFLILRMPWFFFDQGAKQLYSNHLRPLLLRHQARIDRVVDFTCSEIVCLQNISVTLSFTCLGGMKRRACFCECFNIGVLLSSPFITYYGCFIWFLHEIFSYLWS